MMVEADRCVHGLEANGPGSRRMLARKRTRFMTKGQGVAGELGRQCIGEHKRQQLVGGRAGQAVRCP